MTPITVITQDVIGAATVATTIVATAVATTTAPWIHRVQWFCKALTLRTTSKTDDIRSHRSLQLLHIANGHKEAMGEENNTTH